MPLHTLGQRVLSRLVRKLGGTSQAARRLQIPEDLLETYLEAKSTIPERIWLQAVDILMDDLTEVAPRARNRTQDPKGTR